MALAVFAGGLVASLTDWLFMGDWLYKRYNQYPEIWRYPHGQGEMKAIAWYTSSALRHLRGLHTLVRPPKSPLVQRDRSNWRSLFGLSGLCRCSSAMRCSSNCTPQLLRLILSDGW